MVVRPARVSPAHSPSPSWAHELFGCDPTQGIVCVDADHAGHARVWRRVGSLLEATEHRFPNWFLTTSLDLLAHLPVEHVPAETLRAAHGQLTVSAEISVVELDCPLSDDEDAYRYLVLTPNLDEIEIDLVDTSNK